MSKFVLITLIILAVTGCTLPNNHRFTPVAPQAMPEEQLSLQSANGAIYRPDRDMRLFEDRTARRVGDLLTIRLVEHTNARKSANTGFDKETNVDIPNPTLFGKQIDINNYSLETDIDATREFEGGGDSNQSNSLVGEISALVLEVFPNGNLLVRGEKTLTLNQGQEFVQISGVVRPDDIRVDNVVLSTQVADARITYAGTGALADANAAGWLNRFFGSPYYPF